MFKQNGIKQTSDNYARIFSTQERKQENIKQFASAENIFETSKSKAESMKAILQKKRYEDFNMVLFEEQIEDDDQMSAITQYQRGQEFQHNILSFLVADKANKEGMEQLNEYLN